MANGAGSRSDGWAAWRPPGTGSPRWTSHLQHGHPPSSRHSRVRAWPDLPRGIRFGSETLWGSRIETAIRAIPDWKGGIFLNRAPPTGGGGQAVGGAAGPAVTAARRALR